MGITAKCPKGKESLLAMPSPQEIESLVCKLATNKQIEDKAVTKICSVISQHVHVPECHALVERMWEKITAKCPKGKESLLSMPSPQEIESLVCKFATNKQIEDKAVTQICSVISQHVHITGWHAVLKRMWEKITAKCPKGKESLLAMTSPQEIESLVCKVATNKEIEDMAVTKICSVILQHVHIPECHAVLEGMWEKVTAKCPKGKESVLAVPSPQAIESLVCKLATQKQ